jgi:hypothetical protein
VTIHQLRIFRDRLILKDWMIAVVGLLTVKECVAVAAELNTIVYPVGMIAGIVFVGIGGYFFKQIHKRLNKQQRAVCFCFLGAFIILLFGNGGAAHAQFLQNAEDFFIEGADAFGLGESVTLLVSLIFWLIRGAFVIGVAIALLPAIQAAREGEEWRSLAKTPMLVVGIVLAGATSVDFLTAGVGG